MHEKIPLLFCLQEIFRIGVSSATIMKRTVEAVLPMLEHAAGNNGSLMMAKKALILDRHVMYAPAAHIEGGGNHWDTVKPLQRWFTDLGKVVLVYDDDWKTSVVPFGLCECSC